MPHRSATLSGALAALVALAPTASWAQDAAPTPSPPTQGQSAEVGPSPPVAPPARATPAPPAAPRAPAPPQRPGPWTRPYPHPHPRGYPPRPHPYPYPYPRPYPPYYYPAPRRAPPAPGPPQVVHGWDPDDPAPEGYRSVTRPNGRLIGVGTALFSSGYVTSVVAGIIGQRSAAEGDAPGNPAEDWVWLYVPVIGPIAAIPALEPDPTPMAFLFVDSLLQIGGIIGIVVGSVDTGTRLVRTQYGQRELRLDLTAGPVTGLRFGGEY